jgi:hypothetical protein
MTRISSFMTQPNLKGGDINALLAKRQARQQVTDAPGFNEPGDIFWRCNSPLFAFLFAALFGR